METIEVTILEPEAEAILAKMEGEKLIKVVKNGKNRKVREPLQRGSMKGLVIHIADDFDAPLDDFAEYM